VTSLSSDPVETAAAGDRLARESAEIVAMSGALCTAAIEVLAHRLPIIWASSPAPAAWQMAELWRMCLEKPIAAWQAGVSLGLWPFTAAGLVARSAAAHTPAEAIALVVSADAATTVRAMLDAVHEQVAANAERLGLQGRPPR
jgi:hypothetical protein